MSGQTNPFPIFLPFPHLLGSAPVHGLLGGGVAGVSQLHPDTVSSTGTGEDRAEERKQRQQQLHSAHIVRGMMKLMQ